MKCFPRSAAQRSTQRVVFATGATAVWDVTEVRVRLEGRERTVLDAYLAQREVGRRLSYTKIERED